MWKTMTVGMTALAVVAFSVLTFRPVVADEPMTHMEQMITDAKTSADHEALAASYEKAAQEARQKQAEHLKMKE